MYISEIGSPHTINSQRSLSTFTITGACWCRPLHRGAENGLCCPPLEVRSQQRGAEPAPACTGLGGRWQF